MFKELIEDKNIKNFNSKPNHGFLERWARQGVLMINTVLTVQRGNANSHKKKGWELVTDEIIRAVDRRSKAYGKGVVFLLFGKPATSKAMTALGGASSSRHRIICTSHPSPLGATKTKVRNLNNMSFCSIIADSEFLDCSLRLLVASASAERMKP
jgi:uracil-DNA glycosylase